MKREQLVSLCEEYVSLQERGVVTPCDSSADPVPEILRSYETAEISGSEKNALLALVGGFADDLECCEGIDPLEASADDDWDEADGCAVDVSWATPQRRTPK
jgi:hypothetical protein